METNKRCTAFNHWEQPADNAREHLKEIAGRIGNNTDPAAKIRECSNITSSGHYRGAIQSS
jgi:hypothetical protein